MPVKMKSVGTYSSRFKMVYNIDVMFNVTVIYKDIIQLTSNIISINLQFFERLLELKSYYDLLTYVVALYTDNYFRDFIL